ncbi:MAG TPA: molybdate ABC transporter substrate-binding protein [Spirochaetia bacterium]|nr:molybdate ABC transporter substrate-binding protein [Spirochaetia bacterium]
MRMISLLIFLFMPVFLRGEISDSILYTACAGNMRNAMTEIIKAFTERNPDCRVEASYASSGKFFAQISHGAPFEIFISADMKYPKKLLEQNIGKSEVYAYASGTLVLMYNKNFGKQNSMEFLINSRVQKIAIANPALAPYGVMAVSALSNAGLYNAVCGKFVYAENILQIQQYFTAGADAAFAAASLMSAESEKSAPHYFLLTVPREFYLPLKQGILVIKPTKHALQLFAFFKTEECKKILKKHGYLV